MSTGWQQTPGQGGHYPPQQPQTAPLRPAYEQGAPPSAYHQGGRPGVPRTGWWRRNRWGLVLLLPVVALSLVAPVMQTWDLLWRGQERLPVSHDAAGWASYGGVKLRLVEISEEKTLPAYGGKTIDAPPGMRVVKVVLEFDGPGNALDACHVELESTTGEKFAARPEELDDADLGYFPCSFSEAIETTSTPRNAFAPSASASPEGSAAPSVSAEPSTSPSESAAPYPTASEDPATVHRWRTATYFVLPTSSYPAGVRVTKLTLLPEYVVFR
ncbi:MAG: hypothetical protein HOV79_18450 [Hamadaea sp.]|nr:hypothetical protein [Hamadaea sp.]